MPPLFEQKWCLKLHLGPTPLRCPFLPPIQQNPLSHFSGGTGERGTRRFHGARSARFFCVLKAANKAFYNTFQRQKQRITHCLNPPTVPNTCLSLQCTQTLEITQDNTQQPHTSVQQSRAHAKTRQKATPVFQDNWPRPPCTACVSKAVRRAIQDRNGTNAAAWVHVSTRAAQRSHRLEAWRDRDWRLLRWRWHGRWLCPCRHSIFLSCGRRVDEKVAHALNGDLVAVGGQRHRLHDLRTHRRIVKTRQTATPEFQVTRPPPHRPEPSLGMRGTMSSGVRSGGGARRLTSTLLP
jgi:hypothetical protein